MDRRLLTDEQMQRFIIDGYLMLKSGLPAEFHKQVFDEIDSVYQTEGNPGNNLLPRIPMLQQVFDDPRISGALESILGAGYFLYPHRHCHFREPEFVPRNGVNTDPRKGGFGGSLHRDGMSRRRHRTRWALGLYYPQDTAPDMGPTTVLPGSQYYNALSDVDLGREFPLCVDAGTIVITHYDLWHAATPNRSQKKRALVKFMFARMNEPPGPSWDSASQDWQPGAEVKHPSLRKQIWDWHCGKLNGGSASGGDRPAASIDDLVTRATENAALDNTPQESRSEPIWLETIYELAALGEAAVPTLIDGLAHPSEGVRRGFAHSLTAIGEAAVPALANALADDDASVRAVAAESLGDMGKQAEQVVPELIRCLGDESEDVVEHAAEALGLIDVPEPDLPQALGRTLEHAADKVRMRAALALARMGKRAEEATPQLASVLEDSNRYVRGKAVHALFNIGTPEAREALLRHLLTHRWDNLTFGVNTH